MPGRSHGFEWTKERVARLRELVIQNYKNKEICKMLSQEFNTTLSMDAIENIRGFHKIYKIHGARKTTMTENDGFISLEKIKSRFDVKTAIFTELAKIPRGKLISEADLCQRAAGTDRNRFRRTVENNADELKPYRVRLRLDDSSEGKWYWGNISDIEEATKMRDL